MPIRGVLDLLNCVPIHVRLDCFSHSITLEAFTPAQCKTAKYNQIEYSPRNFVLTVQNLKVALSPPKYH